jgi:signal transduction histidine kinase/CheY-like chemotaxis protein
MVQTPSASSLVQENALLRHEVQVAHEASRITAKLVVEQFVRLEEMIRRLEEKNAVEQKLRRELEIKNAALTDAAVTAMEATAAKSRFLACMSHEIRTPLNAILGMTELLATSSVTDEQREYLDVVHAAGESLLAVVRDVLDLSKIEADKLTLERGPFDLHGVVGDAAKSLALLAHERGLELICHVGADVPKYIVGDQARLRQILFNLLGNAIKFTEQGEVILEIWAESRTDEDIVLHFSVRDTGIGIPEDKRLAIFRMFEQADNSMCRRYGGIGLGLTISLRLVRLMEGRIWVDSQVGKGSTFHFTAHFQPASETQTQPPAIGPQSVRDISVLAVDDNATNRQILDRVLRSWEMKPTLVAEADEALRRLRHAARSDQPFQLVITDAHMPVMDGFQLVERIRADASLGNPAVIVLTSGAELGDVNRCHELKIAAHLLKPVNQSELFDTIVKVFATHQVDAVPADAAPADAKPVEVTSELLSPSDQCLKILLVEDSLVNQKLARALLGRRGHQVIVANNGREAVDHFKDEEFDLILMDIQMPEMDGIEATAAIRSDEQRTGTHMPIIALTAHALKDDRERCLDAGMDDYVAKPIRANVLFDTIERTLVQLAAR